MLPLYKFSPITHSHICQVTVHANEKQPSVWKKLPDVPYYYSSASVVDGVLLAIGGTEEREGINATPAIFALHSVDQKWQHVGDMPINCSDVETLLMSRGKLLVVDGDSQKVLMTTVEG